MSGIPAINTFTILSQERNSCNKYIYYPKSGAEFPTSYVLVDLMFNDARRGVIIRFTDIGGICWSSLFKLSFYNTNMIIFALFV